MSTADAPKKPRETDDVPVPATLRKSLKNRHIQLIALGGAIGTGLFYGSSESIALAGPSILLAYLVGGLAIFAIVRALSEMSVEDPKAGAFSYYATRYWSKRAGFISGWNYWFNYILVSMVELSGRHHLRSAHRIRHQSELCQLVHLGRGLLPERSHGAD